jgi:glucosylceramidase
VSSSVTDVVVNSAIKYQSIIGFGGAFTDSSGISIDRLSPEAQTFLLKYIFKKCST